MRGRWSASSDEARVWVDASSIALSVAIEINRSFVEDASWLRKDESSYINMVELDAVIKWLNLTLAWRVKKVEVLTDPSTVQRWISDGISGRSRLKTKVASEMLLRRRIGIVLSFLIEECGLRLTVTLVPSINNKEDSLTRVPQRWLKASAAHPTAKHSVCASSSEVTNTDKITEIHHATCDPGVKRTLYFVKRVIPEATKEQVHANCEVCQSTDPAPVKWRKGDLSVEKVWHRLGMDMTHCGGRHYLTLVDCGPSRLLSGAS